MYVFLLETLRASSPVSSNQTYLYFTKYSSSKNCHHQSTKPSLVLWTFVPFGFGREYVILLVKLWQFALETMAVSGEKCLKR